MGKARLQALLRHAGGYQGLGNKGLNDKRLDYRNYNILLNYRRTHGNIAEFVSVTSALKEGLTTKLVKDRIVLIGVTDPNSTRPDGIKDEFQTPYGVQMRGVFVHAQMVSQLISAALGERPLLGVWSWWGDVLWICGWSSVGGLIVWRIRGTIPVGLTIAVAIVILYGSCFLLFVLGNWVPFVPSVLTLISVSGILIYYTTYKDRRQV